jgi:hypothetical protein
VSDEESSDDDVPGLATQPTRPNMRSVLADGQFQLVQGDDGPSGKTKLVEEGSSADLVLGSVRLPRKPHMRLSLYYGEERLFSRLRDARMGSAESYVSVFDDSSGSSDFSPVSVASAPSLSEDVSGSAFLVLVDRTPWADVWEFEVWARLRPWRAMERHPRA